MNIFSKVTLQSLYRNRTRTIVTIVGVILSVALVTAVASFVSSLQSYGLKNSIANNGDWHIAFHNADEALYNELKANDEVESIALTQEIAYAKYYGESAPDDAAFITIMGFEKELYSDQVLWDKAMGKNTPFWDIAEGRWPQTTTELVVPVGFIYADDIEYHTGDTIVLDASTAWTDFVDPTLFGYQPDDIPQDDLPQDDLVETNHDYASIEGTDDEYVEEEEYDKPFRGTRTYTIVGTYTWAWDYDSEIYLPLSIYTVADPTELDIKTLGYSIIQVTLKKPADVYNFESHHSGYASVYNSDQLRWLGLSDSDSFNAVLYSLTAILIGLIVFGSVLTIYNAFSISVSERRRQFGILSSVGATKKQLRSSVLFEGLCVAVVGIPLGLLLGFAGIGIALKYVGDLLQVISFGYDIPLSLSVSVGAVLTSIAIGILTILISAYIPARRASKTSAIDSIRQTDDIKLDGKKLKSSKLIERFFGLEGSLAHKNFKRNKKRYRSTILSLFVSVVLFISAGAFGMFLSSGITRVIDDSADLLVSSYDQVNKDGIPELFDKLKNTKGVTKGSYWSSVGVGSDVPNELLTEQFLNEYSNPHEFYTTFLYFRIMFLDDESYLEYLKDLGLPEAKYTGQDAVLVGLGNERFYSPPAGRFVIRDVFKKKGDISLAVSFQLDPEDFENYELKELTITLADALPQMISKNTASSFTVFAPHSLRAELDPTFDVETTYNYDEFTLAFLSDNPQESERAMQELFDENETYYYVHNIAQEQEENRALLAIVNIFIYGFTIMITLIAVANVFNTISTSINLRRRELAMLRSVGMTNASVNKMMSFECVFYGIKALFYGILVGILVSILVYASVMSGVDVPFTLPWLSIGLSIVGVFVVVFISMMYAVHTVNKENTIEALRFDG
ncbi:MAG: FtsX-like permease family protein [Coriobacteriia bacterium]|nr:FtsX-like permease family protein [Coriobacteriia bacterium]